VDYCPRTQEKSMSWETWSPFQSKDTRAICAHMTSGEKSAAMRRGALYGIWGAISVCAPVALVIAHPSLVSLCLAAPLVAAHILCIPLWLRKQREFLCNTEWAKSQGIRPEVLRLLTLPGRGKR